MRVIIYLRVSTARQAEEGLGLDVQEAACRKWAREHGHRIAAVLADEGLSGSNGIETRAALAEALHLLKDRIAGGLVVYRLDRLARDLVLQEQLLAEVRRMGAEPFTTSAAEAGYLADDPGDPSRRLIRQVLGAVNEYERAMIALRLRSGRAAKASKGGFAYGSPAYGQRAVDRALVADQAEQDVIRQIRSRRGDGASLREIAAELNAAGIRPKRGSAWHPQTVSRVIQRLAS